MTTSTLAAAARLLREHYDEPSPSGPLHHWTTLVNVVAPRSRAARRRGEDANGIDNGPLRSAREAAQTPPAALAEHLKSDGRSPRPAGTLHGLARWWLRDEEREQDSPAAWDRPLETLRDELRSLPGVSLTLADRLLLLVGGLPAFPIDRTTIRIAARHGWVDVNAEYDEWQTFFTRQTNESGVSLADLDSWFGETGHDYCGVQPRCDGCPLRSLLPPSGPLELSDEGGL